MSQFKYIIILFISALTFDFSFSQVNLVVNGDFETRTCCPHNVVPTGDLICAIPWFRAQCSPDYFNICDSNFLSVPSNSWGSQLGHSGNAYAGFYTYNASQINSSRDYIECQLTSALLMGNKYFVSFYVSLADNSNYATNTVGAYFSVFQVTGSNCNLLNYAAQIQNTSANPLTDKINWTLIQDTLTAAGGEQYLTIGNFAADIISNPTLVGSSGFNGTYYYIDDVSVIDLGPTGVKENKGTRVSLYPNPANTEFTVQLDKKLSGVNITLTDVLGNVVLKENRKDAAVVRLNISQVPDGIYFVSGTSENGEQLLNSKIIIQH